MNDSCIVISSETDEDDVLPSLNSGSEPEICDADFPKTELHAVQAGNPHKRNAGRAFPKRGFFGSAKEKAENYCKKNQDADVVEISSSDDDDDLQRTTPQVISC